MTPTMSANSQLQELVRHSLEVDKTLSLLESNAVAGLTSQQAQQRLSQYGPNELKAPAGRSPWVILLDQFKNIMLLMLIAVAVVSAILALRANQFPKDAIG